MMGKKVLSIMMCALLAAGLFSLAACSSGSADSAAKSDTSDTEKPAATTTGDISVYSREDGSGTRGAFIELFEIEEKDESGEKVDNTTTSAVITNSTSVMMTSIASDENGIGYLSLGSLDSSVKAVAIDGAEPTVENIKSDTYAVSRPFNIATTANLSDAAQDFVNFIMSEEGQAIIEDNGYIAVDDAAKPYEAAKASGKIVVAGSSSVTPVMEKLQEAYQEINPEVTIEVQQSDSTTGMNMAAEETCDIGMASRELKDSELSAGLKSTAIALDGIAVIVNNNSTIDELTSEQVKNIFTGVITTWEEA